MRPHRPILALIAPRGAARAFTLIEILVVVVIIGIAAAIIVPNLGSRDDLKTSSAARMLMADLIYAQNLAIAQQRPHYVRFDTAAQQYEVLSAVSPSAALVTHPVQMAPFLVKFGTGANGAMRDVRINAVTFDGQSILGFDELGVPYAVTSAGVSSAMTSGSVALRCGGHTMTVTIEPFTGELKIN